MDWYMLYMIVLYQVVVDWVGVSQEIFLIINHWLRDTPIHSYTQQENIIVGVSQEIFLIINHWLRDTPIHSYTQQENIITVEVNNGFALEQLIVFTRTMCNVSFSPSEPL